MGRWLHCSLLAACFDLVLVAGLCLVLAIGSAGRLLEAFGMIQTIASQKAVWKEDFDALSGVPHARRPEGSADFGQKREERGVGRLHPCVSLKRPFADLLGAP